MEKKEYTADKNTEAQMVKVGQRRTKECTMLLAMAVSAVMRMSALFLLLLQSSIPLQFSR